MFCTCRSWRNDWSNIMKITQRDSGEKTGESQVVQNTVREVLVHYLKLCQFKFYVSYFISIALVSCYIFMCHCCEWRTRLKTL